LVINLRLFINPLFRAALIFEIGAVLGFAYIFSTETNLDSSQLKMLLVAAAGVGLSRLFFVYDRIFRAEQFVLQNKSIASLLFLLKTKIKPENTMIEESYNPEDMVIFSMYRRHADRDKLGDHHMAFTEGEPMIIDLKTT
jgi:hypothetical protein